MRSKHATGKAFSKSIRRPPWEVADVVPGKRIELLYAEQFPWINLPRIGFRNSGYLAFLGLLGLAFVVHLILFLMKYRAWVGGQCPLGCNFEVFF